MSNFNKLIAKILESNTIASTFGAAAVSNAPYADKDNRPIEPANIVIGSKRKKRKKNEPNQQMVPVFKRPRVESIIMSSN